MKNKKVPVSVPFILSLIIIILVFVSLILYVIPNYSIWQEQITLQNRANQFVGLSINAAKQKAKNEGLSYLEIPADNKDSVAIQGMFVPNRVIVVVRDGRVIEAEVSGKKEIID